MKPRCPGLAARPLCHATGKRQYREKRQAKRAARNLTRDRPEDGKAKAYKCRTCGAFHVGHPRVFA